MTSDRACLAEFENQHWHPRREWSSLEAERIVELHLLIGAKWARMATQFEDRTGWELKNRWHSLLKKRKEKKTDDLERQLALKMAAREHYPWL
jgi:hypothetical protein